MKRWLAADLLTVSSLSEGIHHTQLNSHGNMKGVRIVCSSPHRPPPVQQGKVVTIHCCCISACRSEGSKNWEEGLNE